MSIKFKIIERGRARSGLAVEQKSFIASPVMDGEMNLVDLTKAIEKNLYG